MTSVETAAAGDSVVHRLDPRAKILGLIGLAIVSATTPDGAWLAFTGYVTALLVLAALARLRWRQVLARMTVEVPFLLTAAVVALLGEVTTGATLATKATVGVLAMVVLSSTTPFPRLLAGFERLRTPRLLVLIVAFMWRYLHVIGDEVRRMKIAREARGYDARWLWQAGAIARSVATLFVRALERGERVYLAMTSRGYAGVMPAGVADGLALTRNDLLFGAALTAVLASARVMGA